MSNKHLNKILKDKFIKLDNDFFGNSFDIVKDLDRKKFYNWKMEDNTIKFDNPSFPVYIVSKGRYDKNLTHIILCKMEVKHYMVVEGSEYEKYKKAVDENYCELLILPEELCNTGCSINSRNYCLDHSVKNGFKRHWCLDDNINSIRINTKENFRRRLINKFIFIYIEEILNKIDNIGIIGFSNGIFNFSNRVENLVVNSHVYSFMLILNTENIRWRGRYNEDTDICLQYLKNGYNTVRTCRISYVKDCGGIKKRPKGGNTDMYKNTNLFEEFVDQLIENNKDIDIKKYFNKKWGRYHHEVNYEKFKFNDIEIKDGFINDFYPLKLIPVEFKYSNSKGLQGL